MKQQHNLRVKVSDLNAKYVREKAKRDRRSLGATVDLMLDEAREREEKENG